MTVSELMATGFLEEIDLNPVALYPSGAMILETPRCSLPSDTDRPTCPSQRAPSFSHPSECAAVSFDRASRCIYGAFTRSPVRFMPVEHP